ncbi:MAG TPA: hypothetical protein VJN95_06295 [Gemmatimonadales bacterium]|nr:hypothetical protein [Gemmatimonadales bacterium]
MRTGIRLRLEMGARAAAFCRANPDSNPVTAKVAAKLIELSEKAEELLEQQVSGAVAATTAVADTATIRVLVNADLRALMKISRQADRDNSEMTVHRRIPPSRCSATEFYTAASVALTEAIAHQEVLERYGLSDELLASLAHGLEAWRLATERKLGGIGSKIGAGAGLKAVAYDIMGVVSCLDAVHAVRFRNSPALLAEWKSARNVAWPRAHRVQSAPITLVTPVTPTVPVVAVMDARAA